MPAIAVHDLAVFQPIVIIPAVKFDIVCIAVQNVVAAIAV